MIKMKPPRFHEYSITVNVNIISMDSEIIFVHEKYSNASNNEEVISILTEHWGSTNIVSCGKIIDASVLPRIIARDKSGKLVGLATYAIDVVSKQCELVSIVSIVRGKGVGSRLLGNIEKVAKKLNCVKVWLITTNDNLKAAAFYIKNGYRLIGIHLDALDKSREFKPQIPKIGSNGIPLQDEWKFEKSIK